MTKDIKYRCNLCGEHREPVPENLFGVYFKSGIPSGWLEFRSFRDCETHICCACADAVVREHCKDKTTQAGVEK